MSHDTAQSYPLIADLADALAARRGAQPDDALDARALERVLRLEGSVAGARQGSLRKALPRRVAVALALALHAQPHLASTFGVPERDGTCEIDEPGLWPLEAPLVVSTELLERVTALSSWELDDLRDEVDRRAGRELKQARALQWMWAHFGLSADASPWALFRVLFPGVGRVGHVDLVRRGAQLYALVGDPREESTEEAAAAWLFLPWLVERSPEPGVLTTFRSRYVDRGLRRALGRSVGADAREADELLDRMICIFPRSRARALLAQDQWRSCGPATLTGLAPSYAGAAWLTESPRDEELRAERWLSRQDGALHIGEEPRILFDTLASARVQAMMRQVYAALLASLHPQRRQGPELAPSDLDLLDLGLHLPAVLDPLVDWPRRPEVHQQIAAEHGLDLEHVTRRMHELADAWSAQASHTWLALPSAERPYTVHGILVSHLVALGASLRRLVWARPDPRFDHRPLVLLFAGHYLAEARLERLWLRGLSDVPLTGDSPVPPPEDIVGTWFWPCWRELLDAIETENQATFSGM